MKAYTPVMPSATKKPPNYTQVRQMFNTKDSIGTMGSLNKEGDHSKIDECLKIMDQMQRKIDKYEKKAKD